ncbi:MAG: FtsQ-type POTRA domain-containing protein [Spirochaetales bacterium]|nr:FtsQ-type POTRA domain-containing protein [Spirochaetales bacterium]
MKERKLLVMLTACLGVLLMGEILFNLILAPRLRVRNVVLESDIALEDEALLNLTGLDRDNWYFSLDTEELELSLEKLAVVEEALVEKQFPNKMSIRLRSRQPLVMSLIMGEGEMEPLIMDKEGVVFLTGRSVFSYNLPLLSGVDTSWEREESELSGEIVPLLEDLDRLRRESENLYDIISEINILPRERGVLDIELHLTTHTIPVLLDLPVTEEKMNQAVMVVDLMEKEGLERKIEEIDLRSGSIVYKEREAEGV